MIFQDPYASLNPRYRIGSAIAEPIRFLKLLPSEAVLPRVHELLRHVGLAPADVRGYGKGAIVGIDGDREHTAAVLHPRFGAPVRAAIGGGARNVRSTLRDGALIRVGTASSPYLFRFVTNSDAG